MYCMESRLQQTAVHTFLNIRKGAVNGMDYYFEDYEMYDGEYEDYMRGDYSEASYPCTYQMCPYYGRADMYRELKMSGSWEFDGLNISWGYVSNHLKVVVRLNGVLVAEAMLTPDKASFTAKGNVAGFSADVTLKADFDKTLLMLNGKLCAPFIGCLSLENKIIANW